MHVLLRKSRLGVGLRLRRGLSDLRQTGNASPVSSTESRGSFPGCDAIRYLEYEDSPSARRDLQPRIFSYSSRIMVACH